MSSHTIFHTIANDIWKNKDYNRSDLAASAYFNYSLVKAIRNRAISYENTSLFVMRKSDDIDKITRLATILPTKITITNYSDTITQLDHGVYYNSEDNCWVEWEVGGIRIFART